MIMWFVGKGTVTVYLYLLCRLTGMEALLISVLKSALEGGQYSTSLPDRLTSREISPYTKRLRRLDGPKTNLDDFENREISRLSSLWRNSVLTKLSRIPRSFLRVLVATLIHLH